LILASPASAQYSAHSDGEVVHLEDSAHQIRVSVVPSVGNVAFEMRVKEQNVFYFPHADIAAFRSHPRVSGIPFLGPIAWTNNRSTPAEKDTPSIWTWETSVALIPHTVFCPVLTMDGDGSQS
jgi:hypothetical protein